MEHQILLIDNDVERTTQMASNLSDSEIKLNIVPNVWEASRKTAVQSFHVIALNATMESSHLILPLLFDVAQLKNTLLLLFPVPNANSRCAMMARGFDLCLPEGTPDECTAAIKSLLRRVKKESSHDTSLSPILNYKNLTLDPQRQNVHMGEKNVSLTSTEFQILYLLASNPGIIFSRDRIYERIWNEDSSYGSQNISNHICSIRKKLGISPEDREYIRTVNGAGYCFGAA